MTEATQDAQGKTAGASNSEGKKAGQKASLNAFYGIKAGMTRVFDEEGNHVPVTVIKIIPNFVTQVKTKVKDGYEAYQIAFQEKREKLVNKPKKGHLAKAGVENALNRFAEVKAEGVDEALLGCELGYDHFEAKSYLDVTGVSKGKGFQGVMKRHGFRGGPGAHGSKFHRTPGSIGNRATPARVFKNKKLPGHMGSVKKTVQNIQLVEVNTKNGYLLLKGSVPGSKNSFVRIAKAVKK